MAIWAEVLQHRNNDGMFVCNRLAEDRQSIGPGDDAGRHAVPTEPLESEVI